VHGFPAVLTSFIGRAGPLREVAGLLEEYRLVNPGTGPVVLPRCDADADLRGR